MAYKFIISGETVIADDGRQSLLLEAGERDIILTEMRTFLSAAPANLTPILGLYIFRVTAENT